MALVCAFDFSTFTPGGKLKNLASSTGPIYDATVNGTYVPAPPLLRAKKSPCMDFDGVNNYISLANPISGASAYSIVLWVNSDAVDGMFYSRAAAANTFCYVNTSAIPQIRIAGVGTIERPKWVNSITYMVCVTVDASNIAIFYLNAKPVARTLVGAMPIDANCKIGAYWDNSFKFNGRLDNYLIYNTALTPDQINSIYRSSIPR